MRCNHLNFAMAPQSQCETCGAQYATGPPMLLIDPPGPRASLNERLVYAVQTRDSLQVQTLLQARADADYRWLGRFPLSLLAMFPWKRRGMRDAPAELPQRNKNEKDKDSREKEKGREWFALPAFNVCKL